MPRKDDFLNQSKSKLDRSSIDLKCVTDERLREMIERQDKLIRNRCFASRLPDKGEKLIAFKSALENEFKRRRAVFDTTVQLLSNLALDDDSNSEDLEWNEGKLPNFKCKLDSVGESDDETNPLKLIANHSGTVKGSESKCESTCNYNNSSGTVSWKSELPYVKKVCEKFGKECSHKNRFKPNQLKDNNTDLFLTSAVNVKKRLGSNWEITQATPPVPIYNSTVSISLTESLELQKKQAEVLKNIERKRAAEKLFENSHIKMGDKLPVKNISDHRSNSHLFDEDIGSEEEYHDSEESEDGEDGVVICNVISHECDS